MVLGMIAIVVVLGVVLVLVGVEVIEKGVWG